jgi:serine/threonine-protein kinase RsbW
MLAQPMYDHEFRIASDTREAHRVLDFLVARLHEHAYAPESIFRIRLAFEEALVNAIKHGNHLDKRKTVAIRLSVDHYQVAVEITDEGKGFSPNDVPDPTQPENLERPSGRGLLLMRAYMTTCDFIPPGNICRMTKLRD